MTVTFKDGPVIDLSSEDIKAIASALVELAKSGADIAPIIKAIQAAITA